MNQEQREEKKLDPREERIAKLREQRTALEAERAAKQAERELDEELAKEELELLNAQAIAEAEELHGPIGKKLAVVYTTLGVVILKKPNHVLFKRFQDSSKSDTDEFQRLVTPSLVHPSKADFEIWLKEQPGILPACATQVCLLAGTQVKEAQGK